MFVKCKKSVVVSKQNTIPRAEQRRFVENPSLTKTRKETRDLDSLGSYLNHPDAVEDKVRSNSRFRDGKNVARIGLASTTNLSEDVSHGNSGVKYVFFLNLLELFNRLLQFYQIEVERKTGTH